MLICLTEDAKFYTDYKRLSGKLLEQLALATNERKMRWHNFPDIVRAVRQEHIEYKNIPDKLIIDATMELVKDKLIEIHPQSLQDMDMNVEVENA